MKRLLPNKHYLALLPLCLALAGCMSAAKHKQQLGSTADRELTLGLVQRDVTVGKSQADVAASLGSPNIVTGDVGGREVWIYDKISTEASFSSDSGSIGANSLNGAVTFPAQAAGDAFGNASGTVAANYNKSASAFNVSQRTLTVVIKFNADKAVESVSYNSTRF